MVKTPPSTLKRGGTGSAGSVPPSVSTPRMVAGLEEIRADELKARIEVNQMMGVAVHLYADCRGDEVVMVIPAVEVATYVSQGAEVRFDTKPALIRLFDEEASGKQIPSRFLQVRQ